MVWFLNKPSQLTGEKYNWVTFVLARTVIQGLIMSGNHQISHSLSFWFFIFDQTWIGELFKFKIVLPGIPSSHGLLSVKENVWPPCTKENEGMSQIPPPHHTLFVFWLLWTQYPSVNTWKQQTELPAFVLILTGKSAIVLGMLKSYSNDINIVWVSCGPFK